MNEEAKEAFLEKVEEKHGIVLAIDQYESSSSQREDLWSALSENNQLCVAAIGLREEGDEEPFQTFAVFSKEKLSPEAIAEWKLAMLLEAD